MLKVGLTGGIGCGKSSAVECFRRLSVPVVDADQLARAVVQPGEPVLVEIARLFGPEALTSDGSLNRAWMRQQIFAKPEARQQLESVIHPAIHVRIETSLHALQTRQPMPVYVIVDIPLLVEQGYQSLFDRIVVVDCLPEQQMQRVRERDGSDEGLIAGIMQAQASRERRLSQATDVLDNTGSKVYLEQQVSALHEQLSGISGC
ncbi:MAG: dephospho-CoA kinase [Thiolinea sp.]